MLQDLLEQLRKEPFDPFRITLTNGTHYDVYDPELVVLLNDNRKCFLTPSDGHWYLFRVNRIVSLESLLTAPL